MENLKPLRKVSFSTFKDERGDLTVAELKDYIDFDIKRIYYVTDTKLPRGGHAVRTEKKIYVCTNGKCTGRFFDGEKWEEFELNGPSDAVIMEGFYWREFVNFEPNTVLLALSSINYDNKLYQMNIDDYIKERQNS